VKGGKGLRYALQGCDRPAEWDIYQIAGLCECNLEGERGHLELAGLFVFGEIAVRLEERIGSQPDVLVILGADRVLPESQPGD
jgi:hypothetical protein